MSDLPNTEAQTYSTGELAKACGVSVRTVQYYDEKGLLPPSALTEGGRRVYTPTDAAKLRKIVLLKSLGLKLADIGDFLQSDASSTVLLDILREQDARLAAELQERQDARKRIAAMIDALSKTGERPEQTITDMEDDMPKTGWNDNELRPFYVSMLAVGLLLDAIEIAALVYWIKTGNWVPFVVVLLLMVPAATIVIRMYRQRVAYVCPHCRKVFVPATREWFFAAHTPTTRKVTCTTCGTKDWCAEVSSERLAE